MGRVNVSMLPLRIFLFCFFGALACLSPFLPLHMRSAGLSPEQARIVSIVAPAASVLGPLAVSCLADRLASGLWGQSSRGNAEKGELKDYAARKKGHRRLRTLLAVLVFLSAVGYCLLLLVVPIVTRRDARTPQVSFKCSEHGDGKSGGVIVQERCADECHEWGGERVGSLVLTNCGYECDEDDDYVEASHLSGDERTEEPAMTTTIIPHEEGSTENPTPLEGVIGEDDYPNSEDEESESEKADEETTTESKIVAEALISEPSKGGKPPHLCFSGREGEMKDAHSQGAATCHAFSSPESSLAINATLSGSLIGTGKDELCVYPLSSFKIKGLEYLYLSCRPPSQGRCYVKCSIDQPYDHMNSGPSLLGPSGSCPSLLGDPRLTFWSYLIVRSVADCFPAAALTILDAALLLPSATSPGKHIASGALGIAVAAPISSGLLILQQNEWDLTSSHVYHYLPYPWPPFAVYSFLAVIAAVLLLIFPIPVLFGEEVGKQKSVYRNANCEPRPSVPSPFLNPRRPRHRTRLGPYPPSRFLTHAGEALALLQVLLLLGMFWGGLNSYTSWYLSDMMDGNEEVADNNITAATNETLEVLGQNGWLAPSPPPMMLLLLLGLLFTAASLPAMPLLWYAERIIEICGHANILILAFTFYIVRYAVFSFVEDGWWALLSEAVAAPMSLGLAWVAAVHYTHLLFPSYMSASAQGLSVACHFCLGPCIGAIIGGYTWEEFGLKTFLQGGAITAAIIASLYFLIYHCCLKTRCVGGAGGMKPGGSGGVAWGGGRGHDSSHEGPTTNGNYTPLSVFHNGKGGNKENEKY